MRSHHARGRAPSRPPGAPKPALRYADAHDRREAAIPEPTNPQLPPPPRPSWRSFAWLVAFLAVLFTVLWLVRGPFGEAFTYTELKEQLRAKNVAEVVIRGQRCTGTFRKPVALPGPDGKAAGEPRDSFTVTIPPFEDPELVQLLDQGDVSVRAVERDEMPLGLILVSVLPIVLIVLLMLQGTRAMGRQLGQVGDRLTSFGASRARRYTKKASSVTYADVAGLENAKAELREIVEYLKDPERFRAFGAEIPRGILLMGPPGTGKTLLARATAGEADVPFFSISGSEFVELFVGVGASRVRAMFEDAKRESPAILFIDEIDSVGRARGTGLGGGHDEREQTLNQILAEMDGFSSEESVVVMAATNRPDVLDAALLRPGRFDRKVTLELPQREARRRILELHCKKIKVAEGFDLADLAARTVGFSGADLKNLVNEAALLAARARGDRVLAEHFEKARDKVLLGPERDEKLLEQEREAVAFHESGHALVARLLPDTDPVARVTILPRGHALGVTEQMPVEDRHTVSRTWATNRIAVLLGGRVAERIVFGDLSSGAEDDLKEVTRLAQRMVCQWGMSERLGPVSFRRGEEHVFLGREMAQAKDFSDETAHAIDEEIQAIVRKQEERVEELLQRHRKQLDALAKALLREETLHSDDIDLVLGLAAADTGATA